MSRLRKATRRFLDTEDEDSVDGPALDEQGMEYKLEID